MADAPTREDLTAALRLVLDNSTNVTTAAAQTGRAYTTLRRKIAEGHIPAFQTRPRHADVAARRRGAAGRR